MWKEILECDWCRAREDTYRPGMCFVKIKIKRLKKGVIKSEYDTILDKEELIFCKMSCLSKFIKNMVGMKGK